MEKKIHELRAEDFNMGEWNAMDSFPKDGSLVEVRERVGGPIATVRWNKTLKKIDIVKGIPMTSSLTNFEWRLPK
jgi:hypothetical protein